MRILHVVATYLPARRYGGPIVSVHGLCSALALRGHEVHVLTTNVDGAGVLDVPLATPVTLDGVHVRYFPSPVPRLYWSPAMQKVLRAEAATFDVVHTHGVYLWPGVAAAREAARAGVPVVISPRGMLVPELIASRSRVAKTLWLRMFERRAFARASAVHFTSQAEHDDAVRVGLPLPRPTVIANGVDLPPRPSIPRGDRTLLFLGRIHWKKGIDRVIESLPLLPRVRLIVAGNDEENLTPRLRALAENVGVASRVEFAGPVFGAERDALLARATLFVLLSRNENFGNTVLESLAMETPVILSDAVGLAADVVAAGAGVIGMNDVPALLDDSSRRAAMGARGRALVESRFTWAGVATQMEDLYCSITSRRSS